MGKFNPAQYLGNVNAAIQGGRPVQVASAILALPTDIFVGVQNDASHALGLPSTKDLVDYSKGGQMSPELSNYLDKVDMGAVLGASVPSGSASNPMINEALGGFKAAQTAGLWDTNYTTNNTPSSLVFGLLAIVTALGVIIGFIFKSKKLY